MQINPTGVKEKKRSVSKPAASSVSRMMRFGGVPISVSIPPMLPANASGINKREGFPPMERDMLTTMGSISATVPVLLTKAPTKAVANMSKTNKRVSFSPAKRRMPVPMRRARPVLKMPPPTMKSAPIMMTMGLEKPLNASSGVRTPVRTRERAAQIATKSARMRPLTKQTAARIKTTNVMVMGKIRLKSE